MPSLRLHPDDRERLGAPELLPFDLRDITNREAITIATQGYPTPRLFRDALLAPRDQMDLRAWSALVWLALGRAGVNVDINELVFRIEDVAYVPDPEPVEAAAPEGKAPAARGDSTSSRPTSSTRGATSRARSLKVSPAS